ncbi:Isoprenylcysteine carboxyl methyltransferase family-domain-containing protein [Scheffersomyces xylosifermentans]|uniref:Isoprenylcysteine carboxyl methyltransferase family-domain-containing protein n=1 Tax=Scheffersomyces xylosifermentans TaxID=1304137 RepID=UPI00315CA146
MSYNARENSLLEIVGVSSGIGILSGFLACFLICGAGKFTSLVFYGLFLQVHFLNEFGMTYLYNQKKVHSKSFLIYGNKGNFEFWVMQFLTVWEYLIHRSSVIPFNTNYLVGSQALPVIGGIMVVTGLAVRALAMKTCAESFSHLIETESKQENHKLVTNGIYSIMRHPSYFGFWCFAIGVQVLCVNWINFIANLFILRRFFTVRIEFEEYFLIHKLFGQEYRDYKKKVGIWIPFVNIRDNI